MSLPGPVREASGDGPEPDRLRRVQNKELGGFVWKKPPSKQVRLVPYFAGRAQFTRKGNLVPPQVMGL